MIENIKLSFYETLKELDWMDDDMKTFAKEKVSYSLLLNCSVEERKNLAKAYVNKIDRGFKQAGQCPLKNLQYILSGSADFHYYFCI